MIAKLVKQDDYEVVAPGCPYVDAARRMAREGIHALYVADDQQIVGVVTHIDFIYPLRSKQPRLSDLTVADIMSTPVRGLRLCDTLAQAKRMFEETRFVLIPVFVEDGRLCGAVSKHDLFEQLPLSSSHATAFLSELVDC